MRLCIVTGAPGSGKTTLVTRVIKDRCFRGAAGFFTEEVREEGRRVGFDVVTLDGLRAPLARVGPGSPHVGKYAVDLESFEKTGVTVLEEALDLGMRPLVVDEVGKMELYSEWFCDVMRRIIDVGCPLLATVPLRSRHPLVESLRQDTRANVWHVSRDNFAQTAFEVRGALLDSLRAGGAE